MAPLTRRQVWEQSWPIMLAGAAYPIVGLIDTFFIGRFSTTTALAGIGLGAVIYGIAYWSFGFLRMSTGGLTAQSDGAGDEAEVQAHLLRAVPMGLLIGLLIFFLQIWLIPAAFQIYTASQTIEQAAASYITARLWGLPATLGSLALMGWFVGVGRPKSALYMQLVLNAVNLLFSYFFVVRFGWGLHGVGWASAIGEWAGFVAGMVLAASLIVKRGSYIKLVMNRSRLLKKSALRKLASANGDIFIRTICIAIGFNFFGNAAATQGEIFLAGNHIHMQIVTLVALVLDAFAHTAEARTGAAFGAKDNQRFRRAVKLTSEGSVLAAFICSVLIIIGGPFLIEVITPDKKVQTMARAFLPFCALMPLLSVAAFQMDGIFIGTTQTRAMRNAGVLALVIYLIAHYALIGPFGAAGLWSAFLIYYVARALTLLPYFRTILRDMGQA